MSEDRYRSLVRSGLAPLVEDVPEGPSWEDLTVDETVVVAAPPRRRTPGWIGGLSVAVVVLVVVGLAIVLSPEPPSTSEPADTSLPAISSLDPEEASGQLEAWWSLVIFGDTGGAVAMSHPEAEFDFAGLYESMARLGENIAVSIEGDVFGTDIQALLCYTLTGTTGQQTGAGVFRQHDGEWLIWEIRPQTVGCIQESTTTTTASSTTQVQRPDPLVSPLPVNPGIPLKVVSIRPNNPSVAVVDLESGQLIEYPPGFHALPADATDGAVATPNRDVIIWTNGVARLFTDDLGSVTRVLGPAPPRQLEGFAPALRVVPSPDGQRAWLVQPGIVTESGVAATLVELIDLTSGDQLLLEEVDEDAFPIASTGSGLVLNTDDLLATDEGFVTAPGSQQVIVLRGDGSLVDIGPGRAIAASGTTIAVLVCPSGDEDYETFENNELVLTGQESGDRIEVGKPFGDGVWLRVGGPMIPSDAMPLQTVSPDGSTLLVSLGLSLDINGTPAQSSLIAVNLTDGTTRILAEFEGSSPLATWSTDGEWVALIDRINGNRIDIQLINFTDPNETIRIEDAIPSGHFPLAAG